MSCEADSGVAYAGCISSKAVLGFNIYIRHFIVIGIWPGAIYPNCSSWGLIMVKYVNG